MTDITFPEFRGSEQNIVDKKLNYAYKKLKREGGDKEAMKHIVGSISNDLISTEEDLIEFLNQYFNIVE